LFFALAAVVAVVAVPAGSAVAEPHTLYFTKGEQLGTVQHGTTLAAALRALVAGPTPAEHAKNFRTEIPAGTTLRSVTVRNGVAFVDLSARFKFGGGNASVVARLSQLVYTATAVRGVTAVRVMLDGKQAVSIGGVPVGKPLTRADFGPKGSPPPPPPGPLRQKVSPLVRAIQVRLGALGYLPAASADGLLGPQTTNAIIAFESWEGLTRDGLATAALRTRLATAERPAPSPRSGRRIELSLRKQVVLLVDANGVAVRAIHVSSGKASTPTPPGAFSVFRKELRSWSYPFQEWLPYASYFTGGIAFHEFNYVPTFPASHGCVRIPAPEAPGVYAFATLGTPVYVA
jgi:peptidoglycan hydrolase-like protein with peptidoglycan-binding domain